MGGCIEVFRPAKARRGNWQRRRLSAAAPRISPHQRLPPSPGAKLDLLGKWDDPLPRGLNHAVVLLVTFAFYHQSDTQE